MDTEYSLLLEHFANLGIAIALGLLVGSQRGWHERSQKKGSRVAGIRTYTLIALLGSLVAAGVSTLPLFQAWLLCGLAFLPVATLLIVGFYQSAKTDGNVSITSELAAMMVYWLGVLPAFDLALPAAASAVVIALLLHLRETLHSLLTALDHAELLGTLQFLLASVVLLPLLPDQGFGPWGAISPYQLWWMVVLISGLSLVGYFAMRLVGQRKGVLVTSLTGGLVSSTAVTLSLSRLQGEVRDPAILAAGILLAAATMFARIVVVMAVLKVELVPALLAPMMAGLAVLLAAAWYQWRQAGGGGQETALQVHNPFQLVPALQFAGLLAVVMFASEALLHWFGQGGLYVLSVLTGVADVDAIVLSLGPKGGTELAAGVVVLCIALAAATNTLMKGVYCRAIGGADLGWRVLLPALLGTLAVIGTALVPVML